MSERYRLRIARPAVKALAEVLPEKVATAAYEFITGPLLDNPRRVASRLIRRWRRHGPHVAAPTASFITSTRITG